MIHHQYNTDFEFVKAPEAFDKYTDPALLKYCLGATLYMPAKKDIKDTIIHKKLVGLTSLVMCFEDAIAEGELPESEENVVSFLNALLKSIENGTVKAKDLPLLFLRVRSINQFKEFSAKLSNAHYKIVTGFVFPKFSTTNGYLYLRRLKELNDSTGEILYAMPILESKEIAYKETRLAELIGIKHLLKSYSPLILNIRVGATDFSSKFGVRRGIDYSIYDIVTVRDCLSDIVNFFGREDEDYVISAPVWEYFPPNKRTQLKTPPERDIETTLLKRNTIVNEAIDGLLREVILDKANGFIGKTIIHPTHLSYVNAMQAVTREEYEDARQILKASGGVVKSTRENKMNEINPHYNWAKKIDAKSRAYGVVENDGDYMKLFG